jgi:predicted dehydrogenase
MTEPVRVGVVGCGEVAQVIHLPTLRDLGGLFRVTALCDISPAVLAAVAATVPGAATSADYRDLLARDDVDAVLVANPHVYHAEVALAAMQAGKHVLIEKPMCITLDEADELLAAEARSGVVAQVGFMRRHAPAFAEAVERVSRIRDTIILARVHDVIGQNALIIDSTTPVVRGTDVRDRDRTRAREALAGATRRAIGVGEGPLAIAYALLLGLASHDVSAMRELLGPPAAVLHATQRNGGRAVTGTFDYGPFVCQLQAAVNGIPRYDTYLEVTAAEEVLRVDYDTPYVRHLPARLTVTRRHGEAGAAQTVGFPTRYDSFAVEWRDFHANIAAHRRPKTSIADAREDLVLFRRMVELMA